MLSARWVDWLLDRLADGSRVVMVVRILLVAVIMVVVTMVVLALTLVMVRPQVVVIRQR